MALLWYSILGALCCAYFALAGLDYGVGMLLPGGRDDAERRQALNAIGPRFLGNEVWIVAAAGVLIAAFPRVEGELFGATYPVLVAVLLGLVAVNAGVQLRSRGRRRRGFDALITVASAVLAVGWGMLLGALLTGRPLRADGHVTGYASMFGWYPLLCGAATAGLFALHGAAFLAWRLPDGPFRDTHGAHATKLVVPVAVVVTSAIALGYGQSQVQAAVRNPVAGTVVGVAVVAAVLGARLALRRGRPGAAVLATALAAALPIVAVGAALYPAILVSTVDPVATVTVDGAAAGPGALRLLTLVVAPALPILVLCQAACWWIFRRRDAGAPVYW